jgi:hypothetical protein
MFFLCVKDPVNEQEIVLSSIRNSHDARELFETVYLWMDDNLELNLYLNTSEDPVLTSVGR